MGTPGSPFGSGIPRIKLTPLLLYGFTCSPISDMVPLYIFLPGPCCLFQLPSMGYRGCSPILRAVFFKLFLLKVSKGKKASDEFFAGQYILKLFQDWGVFPSTLLRIMVWETPGIVYSIPRLAAAPKAAVIPGITLYSISCSFRYSICFAIVEYMEGSPVCTLATILSLCVFKKLKKFQGIFIPWESTIRASSRHQLNTSRGTSEPV